MVGGGGGAVLFLVELMASHGDRRTQARAREATQWRWLTDLAPSGWEQLTAALGGSQWRLFVALMGWLSRVETPSVLWSSWLSRVQWCECDREGMK